MRETDRSAVIEYQLSAWRLVSNHGRIFDEPLIRALADEDWDRSPNPLTPSNHAYLTEPAAWVNRLGEIRTSALIIHCTGDRLPARPRRRAGLRSLTPLWSIRLAILEAI